MPVLSHADPSGGTNYLAHLEAEVRSLRAIISELQSQVEEADERAEVLQRRVRQLEGDEDVLQCMTLPGLRTLEELLEGAARTTRLIREQKLEEQAAAAPTSGREDRVCVVCQENARSVLLLPCRHLCLCATCSAHPAMTACPVCRAGIAEKMPVFS
jgi:RING finger protein 26